MFLHKKGYSKLSSEEKSVARQLEKKSTREDMLLHIVESGNYSYAFSYYLDNFETPMDMQFTLVNATIQAQGYYLSNMLKKWGFPSHISSDGERVNSESFFITEARKKEAGAWHRILSYLHQKHAKDEGKLRDLREYCADLVTGKDAYWEEGIQKFFNDMFNGKKEDMIVFWEIVTPRLFDNGHQNRIPHLLIGLCNNNGKTSTGLDKYLKKIENQNPDLFQKWQQSWDWDRWKELLFDNLSLGKKRNVGKYQVQRVLENVYKNPELACGVFEALAKDKKAMSMIEDVYRYDRQEKVYQHIKKFIPKTINDVDYGEYVLDEKTQSLLVKMELGGYKTLTTIFNMARREETQIVENHDKGHVGISTRNLDDLPLATVEMIEKIFKDKNGDITLLQVKPDFQNPKGLKNKPKP